MQFVIEELIDVVLLIKRMLLWLSADLEICRRGGDLGGTVWQSAASLLSLSWYPEANRESCWECQPTGDRLIIYRHIWRSQVRWLVSFTNTWRLLHRIDGNYCHRQHTKIARSLNSSGYVIWLFVKHLSQDAIQRRSQCCRQAKRKVFKLWRDSGDIPCSITL